MWLGMLNERGIWATEKFSKYFLAFYRNTIFIARYHHIKETKFSFKFNGKKYMLISPQVHFSLLLQIWNIYRDLVVWLLKTGNVIDFKYKFWSQLLIWYTEFYSLMGQIFMNLHCWTKITRADLHWLQFGNVSIDADGWFLTSLGVIHIESIF